MKIFKHFGPPGTGKTRRLMGIVEHAVRHENIALHDITYLSFSKAAAEVIVGRMGAKVSDVRWFKTLHSAACKQLGIGANIIDWKDYKEFSAITGMKITPDDMDADYSATKALDFNITKRAWDMHLTTGKPIKEVVSNLPDHVNLSFARIKQFVEAWTKFKEDKKRYDFIDMLTIYDRQGDPLPIRLALLDEAQDLSDLQWRVFHKMVSRAERVHMAGDDDQSIYGFIGASEYGFLEHPCDEEEVISKSWRVPQAIGAVADQIIGKVPHRKDKAVEWKQEPGRVSPLNLSPVNMPWRDWLKQYESIMVLCRHRKGAQNFSQDLGSAGIHHEFNGRTANDHPEARIVHAIYRLKDGKTITARQARAVAEALGRDSRQYREMPVRETVSEMQGVSLKGIDWLSQMSTNRITRARYRDLLAVINSQGYEKLDEAAKIAVRTMHSSKGMEADLVVILPDCTNVVKQNSMTATEIRLCYVAVTRAKKNVNVLVPRTDTYIQHFFGQ